MNRSASPRELYTQRLADRNTALAALTRRRNNLGTLRLVVFLVAAVLLWFIVRGPLSWWWLAIPAGAFLALMVRQSRAERSMECAARSIRFYEQGIARLENRWQGNTTSDGARFLDSRHPYSIDLNVFGPSSLFDLLSIARTAGGENRLAAWLGGAAPISELRARHEAVSELRPLLDLREEIAVLAADVRSAIDPGRVAEWAAAPPARPFPNALRIAAFVAGIATAGLLLLWVGTDDGDARLALYGAALIAGIIGAPLRMRVLAIVRSVEEPARDLILYSSILATIERHEFQSARLRALRRAIQITGRPASQRIAQIRRLMDLLDSRDNAVVRAIGPLVLWTTQVAMAVEAWRAENGPYVAAWLNAVGEMEALASLANYAFEHPADAFPEFVESETAFAGEALGHPLLAEDVCVRNSVALTPPLRLLLVSGSNMSGKSTLLRTVGINVVLAFAGAPVRAARLSLSPVSLGASINTVDSLAEGHSRFMAEILRLKQILDLPQPTLFLLDELLGGTNSHDRALGSEGLVRALLDRGAIGIVTTHDLSLARVADELAPVATNVHFEDRLEDGKLIFDYKMRPGTVTRSNALDLMRAVGLDV